MVTDEEWRKKIIEENGERIGEKLLKLMGNEVPGVEFEGPMGAFYGTEDVPDSSLINGLKDIVEEMRKRGIKPEEHI